MDLGDLGTILASVLPMSTACRVESDAHSKRVVTLSMTFVLPSDAAVPLMEAYTATMRGCRKS